MKIKYALAVLFACSAGMTWADINVGVSVSATGPAASLGAPEKNTFALLPTTIAGQKVNYLILDDASEPDNAVRNVRKLVTESKVDVIVGSTTAPNSLAMIDVATAAETPMISMASAARLVEPMDARRRWIFKDTQSDLLMVTAIVEHMTSNAVRSVAFVGFADAYGEGWWNDFSRLAEVRKLRIVANERYDRRDTVVAEQVARVTAAHPDAVLIAGAGTPAVLVQKTLRETGYEGPIYQTHAVANDDFLEIGGKDVEGTLLPAGPLLVAAQLPENNPIRQVALDYATRYEAAYGKGSVTTFGAHAWDASILLANAIPVALRTGAKPGTREFRRALRDALEASRNVVGTHGVYNLGPRDHQGLDQRSRVMVKIDGGWKLVK